MKYFSGLNISSSHSAFPKKNNNSKPGQHLNGFLYLFFFATIFTSTNPFTMELKLNESKKFEDLTVAVIDGGHKILMDENGKRDGDLSFAEITLQTSACPAKSYRVYHPEGKKDFNKNIEFDNYIVTIKDMEWNGASVKLEIEKKQSMDK